MSSPGDHFEMSGEIIFEKNFPDFAKFILIQISYLAWFFLKISHKKRRSVWYYIIFNQVCQAVVTTSC